MSLLSYLDDVQNLAMVLATIGLTQPKVYSLLILKWLSCTFQKHRFLGFFFQTSRNASCFGNFTSQRHWSVLKILFQIPLHDFGPINFQKPLSPSLNSDAQLQWKFEIHFTTGWVWSWTWFRNGAAWIPLRLGNWKFALRRLIYNQKKLIHLIQVLFTPHFYTFLGEITVRKKKSL